jgi:hypothetical protein
MNDTIRTRYLVSTILGSNIGATTAYVINVQSVKLGRAILGLKWGSVLAIFVKMWMWGWALVRGGEKRNRVEMKKRYMCKVEVLLAFSGEVRPPGRVVKEEQT